MKYNPDYFTENFPNKFQKLLNSRYSSIKQKERRGQFEKDFNNKFPDCDLCTSSINQWFSPSLKRFPTFDKLLRICSLLDCDIDYFLTEQDVFQKDARSASDYLGLSYDTVERISNYDDKIKGLIDVLVFDNHNNHSNEDMKNADLFLDLLDSIHEYAINYSTSSIKYKTASGIEHEITDKKQIDTLLRNNPIRECGTILNTAYVEYSKTRHYNEWLHMNDIIINLSKKGENEDELRKKFHVPKQYNHSIPTHF